MQNRILIVDDESELREIIVSNLKDNFPEIIEAKNGKEALELIKTTSFSLVISDVNMPEMSGLDLLVATKALGVQTPFVFITVSSDSENILKALRLGAFDFVKKPFDEDELISVVNRAVEVGSRRNQIMSELKNIDPQTQEKITKNTKMIELLEISNHKKRA